MNELKMVMNKRNQILSFLVAVGIPLVVGIIGSQFTQSSVNDWYTELQKPAFNPPNFVFPLAWTLLYTFMGAASWLVWKNRSLSNVSGAALVFYGIQLFFNLMWSYLFFTLKNPGLALIEIILLLILIALTTRYFFIVNRSAGWLMVPYLLWVGFATVLNAAIWWLN